MGSIPTEVLRRALARLRCFRGIDAILGSLAGDIAGKDRRFD